MATTTSCCPECAADPRRKSARRRNVDASHPDYHRRNIVIERDLADEVARFVPHTDSGHKAVDDPSIDNPVYTLVSFASRGRHVSPSMIDDAVGELEGIEAAYARESASKTKKRCSSSKYVPRTCITLKQLDDLIAELDAYARYSEEHTAEALANPRDKDLAQTSTLQKKLGKTMARGKKKNTKRNNPTTVLVRREVAGGEGQESWKDAVSEARKIANREGRAVYVDWSPLRKKWLIWEPGGRDDQDAKILFSKGYMDTLVEPRRPGEAGGGKKSKKKNPYESKKDFEKYFKDEVMPEIARAYEKDGRPDKPARREAWNNLVDDHIRDGLLPESAGNWGHPKWLETYKPKQSKRHNPRGSRTRNSHDPEKSVKKLRATLSAADRELLNAVESMEKGKSRAAMQDLLMAAYRLGQARAESDYVAGAGLERSEYDQFEKRLRELESGMRHWAKDHENAMNELRS